MPFNTPPGWNVTYHTTTTATQNDNKYTFHTAAFEHLETALKVLVTEPDTIPLTGSPEHTITAYKPLYEDYHDRVYRRKAHELDDTLLSSLPEYLPKEHTPTINTKLEQELLNDAPDTVLKSFSTLLERPYDYTYLLEHCELDTLALINTHNPELIDSPPTITLHAKCNPKTGERYFSITRSQSMRPIKTANTIDADYTRALPLDKHDPADYPLNKPLAHIHLDFDTGFSPNKNDYHIANIDFTPHGTDLKPLHTRIKSKLFGF